MGAVLSSAGGTLLAAAILFGLYVLYQAVLPKPLERIPYNEAAASKLFGDVPEMMGYVMRTKRIFVSDLPSPIGLLGVCGGVLTTMQCWLTSLTARHQSPIIQAFIKPMSLPWVVVTDPYESQDILLRRTREFDRSGFFGELIGGILPEQHIQFLSNDSRFKNNRNLINHLMAPTFITQVLGPQVYKSSMTMIRVWQLKCDLAKGRPFKAHNDITYMALDTIFAAMFGHPEKEGITINRLEAVSDWTPRIPAAADDPVDFPDGEVPEVFAAALTLANSVTDTQLSPAPRATSWVLRQLPYMKRATAVKDAYIRGRVDECVAFMTFDSSGAGTDASQPRTALHSVLLRERDVAAKEGRAPDYRKRAIADEFFGFMLAGHDTSATTVAWGAKFLADHPQVQARLRADLRAALPEAVAGKRAPTYGELARVQVPYLDAVVEEVLRHANTIAFVVRQALVDTTVLGRRIPKGTDVFLVANGAGYLEPNMKVRDEERSPGARQGKAGLTGTWDDADIGAFKPERWLKRDKETGAETFDPAAGPTLAFGLGPRACFGRRFAVHGLKVQFALIVWHFHLNKTPDELNSYDAVQRFAREPSQCYVRLSNANV
jgi:cytochrome P450